jgi:tryptophan-rich sensory protein
MQPLTATFGIIIAAAILEGILTGGGARRRLETLNQPRWAPPFAVWAAIGVAYYLLYGAILFRLLSIPYDVARIAAIAIVALILLLNAIWNFLFIRRADPRASAWLLIPYSALVLLLLGLLLHVDLGSAALLVPYVAYLPYLTAWSFAVARRNC